MGTVLSKVLTGAVQLSTTKHYVYSCSAHITNVIDMGSTNSTIKQLCIHCSRFPSHLDHAYWGLYLYHKAISNNPSGFVRHGIVGCGFMYL